MLAGLTLIFTAGFLLSLTKSQSQDFSSLTLFLPKEPVVSYKLRLSYTGKCVGSSPDGRVGVKFCDPGEEEQYFQLLPDGKLQFGSEGGKLQFGSEDGKLQFGSEEGKLQFGSEDGKLQFGSEDGKLQFGSEDGKLQFGSEDGKLQFGSEDGKLQFGSEDGKLQFGSEDGKLQFGSEDGKLQFGSEDGKLQFGSEDGKLQFGSEDGKLQFGSEGRCVQLGMGQSRLVLGKCSSGVKFRLVNGSYLQTLEEVKCVSPIKADKDGLVPNRTPANRDPVTLTRCDKDASKIELIEKSSFLESRRHLLLPLPPPGPTKCDFPACGMNKEAPSAQLLPPAQVERCLNLSRCITVITKTARRPQLVLRMVESLRAVDKYRDIAVVAYDDGGEEYSNEIMEKIAQFPNLEYVIGDEKDMGISRGRNLALKRVRTKYFLLLDDDNLINNLSDLELLVEVLDTTDASLVGGAYKYNRDFAGFLNFGFHSSGKRALFASYGSCKKKRDTIPNFPSCVRCELTANAFMAKTRDILEVGGWSDELKVKEHMDLFLRLKAEGKKVVYCPNFKVLNRKPEKEEQTEGYWLLRRKREGHMRVLFNNRWNIEKFPTF